jgi:DNA-binding SARP family transcriptional activator/tetratricopeptide (TPR) repeat protein
MLGEKKILKIALLGPPVVTFEDQVQTIRRRQTRSVLYFLACQKEPVSRGYLISKFWPNLPEQEARKNLREILSNLRSHFVNADVIVSRYDQLSLNSTIVEVDVVRFQTIVDRLHFNLFAMPSGKLPDSLYRDLRDGAALWRTPYFMDGFLQQLPEFETWLAETGSLLQAWRQSFVERLVDHNISTGNLDEAIYWLVDAIKVDPLKTDLHYLMLTCLRDSGKIEAILRYRESLERDYKVSHGMEVPQVLVDFINRISESQKQLAPNPTSNDQDDLLVYPTPFIGRKEVLHQLNTWSLGGGVVELRGESGIGKTRTMLEFNNRIDYPYRHLYCIARPNEQNLPLRPFIEGLKQSIRKEEWLQLSPVHAKTLSSLFPEIQLQPLEGASSQVSLQESLPGIFEAILELLTGIAKQKRLLVFFDNAQWADEISISLLSYLTNRKVFHRNGFLILAHRIGERNHALEKYLIHVQTRQDFHFLLLDQMEDAEIKELVYAILGKVPPAEMITRLKRDVGGTPLFLMQTLKLLMDYSTNIETLASMQSYPVARETLSLMKERMDNMDENTRRVLDFAAVLGEAFTPELLETVTKIEPDVMTGILDDLVHIHVLKIDAGIKPVGGYTFSHTRMRQAILSGLSPAKKRILYLKLIDAMDKRYGKPHSLASRYAQYYELAGETKLAYDQWLQSGLFALENHRIDEVYAAYEKAIALLDADEERFSDKEIHTLISRWGALAFEQSDLEINDQLYARCLEWGNMRHSPYLLAIAHLGMARVMGLRKQMATAQKNMDQALVDLAKCEPDGQWVKAYLYQGYLSNWAHDFVSAREKFEKAVQLQLKNEDEGASFNRAAASAELSMLYSQMGDPRKASEYADLAIEGGSHWGCVSARVAGFTAKCMAQFYLANYREVFELADTLKPDLSGMKMARWTTIFYSILSSSYLAVGQLDKAWTFSQKTQTLATEFPSADLDGLIHGLRGDIYLQMDALDEAEQEYGSSLGKRGESVRALENLHKLGYVKALQGDRRSGAALIEKALTRGMQQGLGMIVLSSKATLLQLKSMENDSEGVVKELEELILEAGRRGFDKIPLGLELEWMESLTMTTPQKELWELRQNLVKRALATSNIWLELSFHLQIIESGKAPAVIYRRSRTRVKSILDMLVENALSEPVRDLAKRYVEKIEIKLV